MPLKQLREDLAAVAAQAEEAKPEVERRPGSRPDPDYATALALARLRAMRMVAGVPWRDVVADPLACERAQAAAELTAAVGGIRNKPDNPGLSEEQYETARAALDHCLLAQGWQWPKAMDAWFFPPRPRAVSRRAG